MTWIKFKNLWDDEIHLRLDCIVNVEADFHTPPDKRYFITDVNNRKYYVNFWTYKNLTNVFDSEDK